MRKPVLLFIVVFGLAAMLTVACARSGGDREWLHFRGPQQAAGRQWQPLPIDRVQSIPTAHLPEAISLLSGRVFHELTAQEIARLEIGKELAGRGAVAYLVRAVSNAGTPRLFTVLTDGNAIVVHQGSLAKHTTLQKDAAVVVLERAPSEVFVEVSGAE